MCPHCSSESTKGYYTDTPGRTQRLLDGDKSAMISFSSSTGKLLNAPKYVFFLKRKNGQNLLRQPMTLVRQLTDELGETGIPDWKINICSMIGHVIKPKLCQLDISLQRQNPSQSRSFTFTIIFTKNSSTKMMKQRWFVK